MTRCGCGRAPSHWPLRRHCAVLAPVTPSIGEEITLVAGTLFTDTDADLGVPTAVGLVPDDHRDTDWLDPRALYRCHNQTVRLELRIDSHTNGHARDTTSHAA